MQLIPGSPENFEKKTCTKTKMKNLLSRKVTISNQNSYLEDTLWQIFENNF